MGYEDGDGIGAGSRSISGLYVGYGRDNGTGRSSACIVQKCMHYAAEFWYRPRQTPHQAYEFSFGVL